MAVIPLFVLLVALFIGANATLNSARRSEEERANRCGSIPRYPQKDPFLGLDTVIGQAKAIRNHGFLDFLYQLYNDMPRRAKTFSINILGTRQIYTVDPANAKALFSTQWQQFLTAPLRRNAAVFPFADRGISLVDGEEWKKAQALSKSFFERDNYANTDRLGPFMDRLLDLLPEDGVTFDIHPFIQRWTLDVSTIVFFGENLDSLNDPERVKVTEAMLDIQRGARIRLVFSKLRWLMPMKWWFEAIAYIHRFLDNHVQKTYLEIKQRERRVEAGLEVEPERTDLLWNMALNLRDDAVGLRSNIALIFAPNGDPTNSYITNAIWQLARHPAAWEKVREEVIAHGDAPLTFTALRNMKYLMAVLNEGKTPAQRLMPGSLIQARTAGVDTTLPAGGGPDGTMPILIRKGDIVSLHRNVLHWDRDIWGEDAKEFRPERWEQRKSFWAFIPFGGGPRRCPAQMIVSCQASYVIARLAQRYRKIEARDPGPYIPVVRIAPSNKNGVKIALFK